jgi:3-oxoadipate enol-lactonase
MEVGTVVANGVQLQLRSWGHAERGPPLLLLHAAGETSLSWAPLAEAWSRARRVHALDFRGHGQSERTPLYSLEAMRDDVVGMLEALDLDEVSIVGHSLGGMVGYLIASMRRPELTRLVLEEAPPPLPLVPARQIPEDPGEDVGFDWRAIRDLYAQRNHPDPSWWRDLDRIDIPVLVVAGGQASHVDQDQMRAMADRIPGATLVTIEAGHNIHAVRRDDFMGVVSEFLGA